METKTKKICPKKQSAVNELMWNVGALREFILDNDMTYKQQVVSNAMSKAFSIMYAVVEMSPEYLKSHKDFVSEAMLELDKAKNVFCCKLNPEK